MPFTRGEFLDKVAERITKQGYFGMSFGSSPTTHNSLITGLFQEQHRSVLSQWCEAAGFRIVREFSCYGVPTYYVEL